jgi:hypothetical protein
MRESALHRFVEGEVERTSEENGGHEAGGRPIDDSVLFHGMDFGLVG